MFQGAHVSSDYVSNILGLIDEDTNSSILSANIIPPVILADGPTKVYIDNGRGLEPEISPLGLETLITSATGGEQFFQLENFPIIKANVVSQNVFATLFFYFLDSFTDYSKERHMVLLS